MSFTGHIEKHKQMLINNAAECVVLLKKDGKFPLEKPCGIALFGNGARHTIKGGTGSGDVNCITYNSIEAALENAGYTVTTKAWLDGYEVERNVFHEEWKQSLLKKAEKTSVFVAAFGAIEGEHDYDLSTDYNGDACLYVLSRNSGEGNDRAVEKGSIYGLVGFTTNREKKPSMPCGMCP